MRSLTLDGVLRVSTCQGGAGGPRRPCAWLPPLGCSGEGESVSGTDVDRQPIGKTAPTGSVGVRFFTNPSPSASLTFRSPRVYTAPTDNASPSDTPIYSLGPTGNPEVEALLPVLAVLALLLTSETGGRLAGRSYAQGRARHRVERGAVSQRERPVQQTGELDAVHAQVRGAEPKPLLGVRGTNRTRHPSATGNPAESPSIIRVTDSMASLGSDALTVAVFKPPVTASVVCPDAGTLGRRVGRAAKNKSVRRLIGNPFSPLGGCESGARLLAHREYAWVGCDSRFS